MKFQKDNLVKLNPLFGGLNCRSAPVWGGQEGFIGGKVLQAFTHKHRSDEHSVIVDWYNGATGEFKENDLAPLSEQESQFSFTYLRSNGAVSGDIFILLKTASGRYVLNVIESLASHSDIVPPLGQQRYTTMVTKHALPVIHTVDVFSVAKTLSFPDVKEVPATTMYGAFQNWFNAWNIEIPRSVYGPQPTFKSLTEAVAASPTKAAPGHYAFFRLPNNLCDYSVMGS